MATTYAQVLAQANQGKLTFRTFLDWWNNTGAFEGAVRNVPEVTALLAVLKTTEPNQDFVKGNQIQIINGEVAVFLQTTPAYPGQSIIGGAAEAGSGAVDQLKGIGKWFVKNLPRIGEIIVGVVIIGVATAAAVKGGKK